MKNRKFKALIVLTLIFALAISMPMSVSAKTTKVGKTRLKMAVTYCTNSAENAGKVELMAYCPGAKKLEFYRAKKLIGKYKKVATTKNERFKKIRATDGLSFFKVKGVKGKVKGKMSSVFTSYKADISLAGEPKVNANDNSITISFNVDNTAGNCDMVFKNTKYAGLITEYVLSDAELKDVYSDKELKTKGDKVYFIDEDDEEYNIIDDAVQNQEGIGTLVDENGAKLDSVTIAKGEQGIVNFKCVYNTNEDNLRFESAQKQLMYATKVLSQMKEGNLNSNWASLTMRFNVKSGSKTYGMNVIVNTSKKGLVTSITSK